MGLDSNNDTPAGEGSPGSSDRHAPPDSPSPIGNDETVLPPPATGVRISNFMLDDRIDVDSNNQFGEVWLAHRIEPYQRVAIKFLRRDRVNEDMVQRFSRVEAKALAMFNHPYIARFYELGFYDGTPYLVMQYVPGGYQLTAYADRHRLSIEDRLKLMAKVCDAVQHVHLTGVVHRDLKPANILVSESRPSHDLVKRGGVAPEPDAGTSYDKGPIPILIDFGLAKSVNPDSPLTSKIVSRLGGMAGTYAYASPEQISARRPEDTGRPADIYALGAVLFELLAGVSPMAHVLSDQALNGPEQLMRLANEQRPSMLEAFCKLDRERQESIASARGLSVEALKRALRSRLGHLTDRALRQVPSDRFSDARAFASDIANYLAQRDFVEAAAEPRLDKLRRWAWRNRVTAGASAAVLVALTGGGALATWQWIAAARERDLALSSLSFFERFLGPVQEDGGSDGNLTIGELLTVARLEVTRALGHQPEAAALVLAVLAESAISLGEFETALALSSDGIARLRDAPDDMLQSRLEDVRDEAEFRIRPPSSTDLPGALKERLDAVVAMHGAASGVAIRKRMQYANSLKWAGRLDEAGAEYQRVLECSKALYGSDSIETLRVRHNMNTLDVIRAREATTAKDADGAAIAFSSALRDRTAICKDAARLLPPDHWLVMWCEAELLGIMAESGDAQGAVERYPELLERQRMAMGDLHWRTVETQARYGKALATAGNGRSAVPELMAALSVYRVKRPQYEDTFRITDYLVTQLVKNGWVDLARHVLEQSCSDAAAAAAWHPGDEKLESLATKRQEAVRQFCDTYGPAATPSPWPAGCTCAAPKRN